MALGAMDTKMVWVVEWWRLEDNDRPIAVADPRVVPLVKHNFPPAQVWPLPSPARRGRVKAAAEAKVAAAKGEPHAAIAPAMLLDAPEADPDVDEGAVEDEPDEELSLEEELLLLLESTEAVEARLDCPPDALVPVADPDEPPLPPPLLPPAADPGVEVSMPARKKDQYGIANVWLPTGRITAYKDGRFEAVCLCTKHQGGIRCVLSRTVPKDSGVRAIPLATLVGRGKPLGLLAAFLLRGPKHTTRCLHVDDVKISPPSLDERSRAREQLVLCEGAADLLAQEADGGVGPEPLESF